MSWIFEPWTWYISGPMIALVMALLIFLDKGFGMSSSLRTICTICGAGKKTDFFKFDWKTQKWNLTIALGAIIGGFIGANFVSVDHSVAISSDTINQLQTLGFKHKNIGLRV